MGEGTMRMAIGYLDFADGHLDTAAEQLGAAHEIFGPLWIGAAAMCRAAQAQIALAQNRTAEARAHADEAIQLGTRTDTVNALIWARTVQASIARRDGDARYAEELLHDALDLAVRTYRRTLACDLLEGLVWTFADQGRTEEAARLLGAADALRATAGCPRFPVHAQDHERGVAQLRAELGDDMFGAAHASGAALSFDDAIAYSRRGRGHRQRRSHGWDSLTPSELQVVELVAEGLTNPQIGERLFISKRTVQSHLAHVFTKLGVTSRVELAANAATRRAAT
jgi:DNA-binding CsgD family transcriptional regulator